MEIHKLALVPLVALSLACERRVTTAASVEVQGRANANPSIAARGEFVAIAWSAAGDSVMDVYAAVSADGGATFSTPARVNHVAGDAKVNSEQPPRIALVPREGSPNPDVVVVWTTKSAGGTRLLVGRSTDGGKTFAAAETVPGSVGAASRGWQSVAVDSNGRVGVLWLDHRDVPAMAAAHHHGEPAPANAPKSDPTARAAFSKLYFAALGDSGAASITGGVCYCCKTSLVATGDGYFAAWRHVFPGSHRDIAFTSSRDGGRTFATPVRVSEDGWQIDGCPENGPAIAVAGDGRIHIAWPAPADGNSTSPHSLFYASSIDGQTFSKRMQIPGSGPVAHIQLSVGQDGAPLIVWDEVVNGARHIAAARVRTSSSGAGTEQVELPDQGADRGWPVIAASASGPVIAWVKGTGPGSSIGIGRLR